MEISKICERIKERRKALNMTQRDLADAMHVSNQLISKWETGESVPTLEYIQQPSASLQMSVQELMGIGEAPTAEETPVQSASSSEETKETKFAKIET